MTVFIIPFPFEFVNRLFAQRGRLFFDVFLLLHNARNAFPGQIQVKARAAKNDVRLKRKGIGIDNHRNRLATLSQNFHAFQGLPFGRRIGVHSLAVGIGRAQVRNLCPFVTKGAIWRSAVC